MQQRFIGVKEAREMLGLSSASIYRYIQQKRLPATKIHGKWLLPIQELEKILQAQDGKRCAPGFQLQVDFFGNGNS